MLKRASNSSRSLLTGATKTGSCSRLLFTAPTRPLQAREDGDRDHAKNCERTKEAAEAVEKGAQEVRNTVASTTENVTKMAKDVTETVTGKESWAEATTDLIKDKALGKSATDVIKKKAIGK